MGSRAITGKQASKQSPQSGCSALRCQLTTKRTQKLKAQLVARGFQQRPGIDFDEKFPSTFKWESEHTNRDSVGNTKKMEAQAFGRRQSSLPQRYPH